MVRDKSFSHHDSREAPQQQGRAFCHLVNRSGRPYLDDLLYELVNDPGVPAQFRDSLGLCERHGYLMLDAGDGLATAILYRAATRKLLEFLSPVPDCPGPYASWRAPLGRPHKADPNIPVSGTGCLVCRTEKKAEGVILTYRHRGDPGREWEDI